MPPCARKEIVVEDEVGIYHCYSRCVRGAFLCGFDQSTGIDYSHRREWFDVRIRQMQQVFMIDVLAYGILENHFHTTLRIRPDLVAKLSDREVARRSLQLSPNSFSDSEQLPEPSKEQIDAALADPNRIKEWRERLSSLSWYMRYLKEPIARRANAEDGVKGHFFEERFHSIHLLDEIAVVLNCIYVDLNEIRAGIAETPEQSRHSSICRRIAAWRKDRKRLELPSGKRAWQEPRPTTKEPTPDWLAPINEQCDNGTQSGTITEEMPCTTAGRPSNSGFLPMSVEQYFQLCDWIGRNVRKGKRGAIPAGLAPILDRLTSNLDLFLEVANNFGRLFKRCCGSPEAIRELRLRQNAKKIHGLKLAQDLYPSPG